MKIYSINVNAVSEKQLSEQFEQMSRERKISVEHMQSMQKQKLRICADALCRKAISEFCDIKAEDIRFSLSPSGKPYADGLPVNFSISHSGDMAVCAISDKEIGIDIEKIRKIHPRAHEKFCTESEAGYISTSENGFFQIWTLKEAYFKCIGTGLGSDIKNVSFSIERNTIFCSEKGFEFSFVNTEDSYVCSVCKKT